jgi:hypothetical protein
MALVSLLSACRARAEDKREPVRNGDESIWLRDVVRMGRFDNAEVKESSGMAPASGDSTLFWTHNDSGNEARLYAVDSTGRVRGRVRVRGATNTDWEAIASGPCPEGRCLYIADVGDNGAKRPVVALWRVAEPRIRDVNSATATRLVFRLADGPQDIEAIYVAPDTSVWLISKRPARSAAGVARPARVYRLPAAVWTGNSSGPTVAELIDSLPIVPQKGDARDWITDAALSPPRADGSRRLAVLTSGAIQIFRVHPETGRPGLRFARCALPVKERDAEAIGWLPDGRLLFTNEGKGAPLYSGRCP